MKRPQTHYAKSGDMNIAYQVIGNGPIDLVMVPGWASHLDGLWDSPLSAAFYEGFAKFARVILIDKRGTGLSDRVSNDKLPSLEERMDDLRAVMDAVGSEKAALFGYSEGGPMCCLFAATYPERTIALCLYGSMATFTEEHSLVDQLGLTFDEFLQQVEDKWAEGFPGLDIWAPSVVSHPGAQESWARSMRMACSPGAAAGLIHMLKQIDITDVLPSIRRPTLVMHRADELAIDVSNGRFLGENIPDAKYVELAGTDHLPWIGDYQSIVGETQEFLTGQREEPIGDTVLATVLFTDIVQSTEIATRLGDKAWRDLLDQHHSTVRSELQRFRGVEVDTAGDGFLATFDGPARAIRAATSIIESLRTVGIDIRVGLHTGECERMGEKVTGLAVHIGARVMAAAEAGEVLVSSTVRDLVAGSDLVFEEHGTQELKGVPGMWNLFRVT